MRHSRCAGQSGLGRLRELQRVPGWFPAADTAMFDWILRDQEVTGVAGDVAELGVYSRSGP